MGNLKSAFTDFEIFQGKSCACDAVERVWGRADKMPLLVDAVAVRLED